MNAIFPFVLKHGYSIVFVAMFAHQIGFPLPGPLFLLSAGAIAASGKLRFLVVIGLTVTACVLADWVWYEAGRRGGDTVLHFMHRFTHDPDFHDRRAKRIFARYGLSLLLVAKFVPGVDAVAPPLAGIAGTSRVRFMAFDGVGASFYACVYGGLGYVFSHDLNRAATYVSRAGTLLLAALAIVGFSTYIAHKLVRLRHVRESRLVRITSADPIGREESVNKPCEIIGRLENGD